MAYLAFLGYTGGLANRNECQEPLSFTWHFSRCQVIKQRIKMLNFSKAMTHRFSNFQQVSTAAGCFCGAWCIGFAKQDRCCLVMCTVSASPTVLIAVPVISRYISSSAASKHFIHIPLDLALRLSTDPHLRLCTLGNVPIYSRALCHYCFLFILTSTSEHSSPHIKIYCEPKYLHCPPDAFLIYLNYCTAPSEGTG